MAIYRLSAQVIKRSEGRSACAAAAYRAAARIADPRTGEVHDYRRRSGVDGAQVFAPVGAPSWATDRARLWAEVENVERRRDAQLAREVVLSLPVELAPQQNAALIERFVQEQFVREGMVADVALHGLMTHNPHAHVMLTLREIGPEGFGKKQRAWNSKDLLLRWREAWAAHVNQALEHAGIEARVDHRSLADQGIERLPQPKLGPAAAAMERKGVRTERGDELRRVQQVNAEIEQINAGIRQVAAEVHQLQEAAAARARTAEQVAEVCNQYALDADRLQPEQIERLTQLVRAHEKARARFSAALSRAGELPDARAELARRERENAAALSYLQEARRTVSMGRQTLQAWQQRSILTRGLDALGAAILRAPTEAQRLQGLIQQAEEELARADAQYNQAARARAEASRRVEALEQDLAAADTAVKNTRRALQQYAQEVQMEQVWQQIEMARSAAARWRAEQVEEHRQLEGVVYVSAEGEVAGWRRHGLGDPAGLAPGSLAVDALGQVWEAVGGDPQHGAQQWQQIAEPDPDLDPDYGEDYGGPSWP